MRDRIGNTFVALGLKIRRTKRYSGGTIPTPPAGESVRVMLSPGITVEDFRAQVARLRRTGVVR